MIRQGDLVVFENGQYGVVTDPSIQTVFLSNGCDTFLSDHEWERLRPVHDPAMDDTANFVELVVKYLAGQYGESVKPSSEISGEERAGEPKLV